MPRPLKFNIDPRRIDFSTVVYEVALYHYAVKEALRMPPSNNRLFLKDCGISVPFVQR